MVDHDILFDENMPASEGRDFLIRLSRVCTFDSVPDPLVKVHSHDGPRLTDLVNPLSAYFVGQEKFIEKYRDELKLRPKAFGLIHFMLAH